MAIPKTTHTDPLFDDDSDDEAEVEYFYILSIAWGRGDYMRQQTMRGTIQVKSSATEADIFGTICRKSRSSPRIEDCSITTYYVCPNKRDESSLF